MSKAAPPSQDAAELNRRGFTRAQLKTSVTVASETNFYAGLTNDISEGGLFVATFNIYPIGSHMELEFSLPDEGPPIAAQGEVRWIREHNPAIEGHPGMGLRFVEIDDKARQRIEAFVAHRDTLFYEE